MRPVPRAGRLARPASRPSRPAAQLCRTCHTPKMTEMMAQDPRPPAGGRGDLPRLPRPARLQGPRACSGPTGWRPAGPATPTPSAATTVSPTKHKPIDDGPLHRLPRPARRQRGRCSSPSRTCIETCAASATTGSSTPRHPIGDKVKDPRNANLRLQCLQLPPGARHRVQAHAALRHDHRPLHQAATSSSRGDHRDHARPLPHLLAAAALPGARPPPWPPGRSPATTTPPSTSTTRRSRSGARGGGLRDKGALVVADTGNHRLLTYTFKDGRLGGGTEVKLAELTSPGAARRSTSRGNLLVLDGKTRRIVKVDGRRPLRRLARAQGAGRGRACRYRGLQARRQRQRLAARHRRPAGAGGRRRRAR